MVKGKEAGQGSSRPEDKGKGKEAKPLSETKGLEAAPKAKDAASKATDPPISQPNSKEDPSPAKA